MNYRKLFLWILSAGVILALGWRLFGNPQSALPVAEQASVKYSDRVSAKELPSSSDNSDNPDNIEKSDESSSDNIDDVVRTLAEFRTENITSEKPAVLQVSRNLFSKSQVVRSYPKFESQNTGENYRIAPPVSSISLNSVSPSSVHVKADSARLVLRGSKFEPDMRVYVNGRSDRITSTFINSEEMQVVIPAEFFTEVHTLRLEIKKPSNETRSFSNALQLAVKALPFVFMGQVAEHGGHNVRVILFDRDRLSASIGETVQGRWRVLDVAGDYLEIEDIETGSRHRLKKGEQPAVAQEQKPATVAVTKPSSNNSVSEDNRSNSLDPELFGKPARPMTYQELLQKRSEAARQKKR